MEFKDVRIGQIVTVSIDSETLYKVIKVTNQKVDLIKMSDGSPLIGVSCIELNLLVNS